MITMPDDRASRVALSQFNIAEHYDTMAELDRDVHDNEALSAAEVSLALTLLDNVPKSVFLPCFGTGRHIPHLLKAGVQRIVGVDLSSVCVVKASELSAANSDCVTLICKNLLRWRTEERFDAVLLLGNSFGDLIDEQLMCRLIRAMTNPLKPGGGFVMDYIGGHYLQRCREGTSITWDATYHGQPVKDTRTPRYDLERRVMTIDVSVVHAISGETLWCGCYQKLILPPGTVYKMFGQARTQICSRGQAYKLNPYYKRHHG